MPRKKVEIQESEIIREAVDEKSLEEYFAELNHVIQELERSDISLEDSFRTYQQGMELLKKSNQKIDYVEKKMQIIDENGELHDF